MAASSYDVALLNKMNSTANKVGLGNLVNIQAYTSAASAGGAASEALTVTGLAAGDTILAVSQKTAGAGTGKNLIGWSTQAADALTVTWDSNPGAGAVVVVLVQKAAV